MVVITKEQFENAERMKAWAEEKAQFVDLVILEEFGGTDVSPSTFNIVSMAFKAGMRFAFLMLVTGDYTFDKKAARTSISQLQALIDALKP